MAHYGWHQFIERYVNDGVIRHYAAGAEPAYMKSVFDSYTDLTNGLDAGADAVFDNFAALAGRPPRMLADFIRGHAAAFRY